MTSERNSTRWRNTAKFCSGSLPTTCLTNSSRSPFGTFCKKYGIVKLSITRGSSHSDATNVKATGPELSSMAEQLWRSFYSTQLYFRSNCHKRSRSPKKKNLWWLELNLQNLEPGQTARPPNLEEKQLWKSLFCWNTDNEDILEAFYASSNNSTHFFSYCKNAKQAVTWCKKRTSKLTTSSKRSYVMTGSCSSLRKVLRMTAAIWTSPTSNTICSPALILAWNLDGENMRTTHLNRAEIRPAALK